MNAEDLNQNTPTTGTERLGFKPGMVVQEIGWDEDCDTTISEAVEDVIGSELIDEDSIEPCDAVLLWWRSEDGDLVDTLVDTIRVLDEGGCIWLLTPGTGQLGALEPGIISEAAQLAGLVQTKAERLSQWQGSCLVPGGVKHS
ncbi:DUF3052 domain-containing protein [Corynebacterium sp. ES2794-CONJ1]|uniref:DUF3052 domain-containing protein n=1 Tax=unclassified Corynebacterium TaxID=2624378 RepID=UPI002168D089|nr:MULTISPECIES: DUF3052 domain-containing protein [unclassified Corynebacterium]MCS4490607.1 DUF3052 domain-containing protein [Corynebacterium sp. ES2775-CONJ]MCS4492386.1 DUF3052 domain-containing protein [Corynebacterium sp. ES2715-CONJ3]MCS4532422.1 DUF3052 domain-containing protein [Corynebacterium sp. ES2730-CONJ]MCU9519817.1 DUF3052 domain-containing protein [Corynebacterium sp. ES2794-CONJ1]